MPYENFKVLQEEITRRLYSKDDFATRHWLRRALWKIASEHPWKWLTREEVEISIVKGDRYVALPANLAHVEGARFKKSGATTYPPLTKTSIDLVYNQLDDPDDEDVPSAWYDDAQYRVKAQPSSASVIQIKSDSTSDSTKVRVRGISGGLVRQEQITLSGTTGVNTTLSFTTVYEIVKEAKTTGVVSATSNAGAVTLVEIPPEDLYSDHRWIGLSPVPDQSFTLLVRGAYTPIWAEDYDFVPQVPLHIIDLILLQAEIEGQKYERDSELASAAAQQYQSGLASAKKKEVVNTSLERPIRMVTLREQNLRRGTTSPFNVVRKP